MTMLQDIKRAQSLSDVRLGMVVLSYTILTVAMAVYFIDGGRPYVMPLCLAYLALRIANRYVKQMADRAAERADPAGRLLKLMDEARRRPKPLVTVTIRPVIGAECRYAVTVHNGSPDMLTDGSLDHSWLLHPGKFGLDDTHMPSDIWVQPPMRFNSLAPGEEITSEALGYGIPEKYDGPKDTTVTISTVRVTGKGTSHGVEKLTTSVLIDW